MSHLVADLFIRPVSTLHYTSSEMMDLFDVANVVSKTNRQIYSLSQLGISMTVVNI